MRPIRIFHEYKRDLTNYLNISVPSVLKILKRFTNIDLITEKRNYIPPRDPMGNLPEKEEDSLILFSKDSKKKVE